MSFSKGTPYGTSIVVDSNEVGLYVKVDEFQEHGRSPSARWQTSDPEDIDELIETLEDARDRLTD